jgi:hypothetical protein
MMKKLSVLVGVLAFAAALGAPGAAAADLVQATAGAAGVYPPGTEYTGIDVSGLQLGFGAEIDPSGSALGNLSAVLVGVSGTGGEQRIVIDGYVTGGSRTAVNVVVLSGTSTVDLGDGTPALPGVPFTATVTKDFATNQGTVGIVLGVTNLPSATINQGSLSIKSAPSE